MNLNNAGSTVASRLASLEVVDEFGKTVAEYGPYNNAITDGYQYTHSTATQNGRFFYCSRMSFYTGARYPIKYRGPSAATITGNILYAPGLLSEYGLDISGVGYVNSPSLTGKVVKFDSGEEYYISGVVAGDIVLRSGGRIRNKSDVTNGGGGFWASSQSSWFFPSTADMPTPTNYTVWDVGDYSHASAYGDSPSISTTTFMTHGATFHPTRTGMHGIYSGRVVMSDKLETAAFGSDLTLGKISVDIFDNSYYPIAHVNIGGDSGIPVLAGQKVRATYETVLDLSPMYDSLTGIISSPIISGMPTSSGFYIPYGNSQPVNATTVSNGQFGVVGSSMGNSPITYGTFHQYLNGSAVLYPIYTTTIINAMSVPTLANPSGSLNRGLGLSTPNTGGQLTQGGGNISSGNNIFIGSTFYNTNRYVFTADINSWNGTLTGLYFIGAGAFFFYQPQVKSPEYELSIPFNFVSYRRQLIN